MAKYVILGKWTDQGIKNASDTVDRAKAFEEMAKDLGGSVDLILWTMGQYDLVAIATFPDDETASKAAVKVGGLGNVRAQTLRAFTADEVATIVG